jgi:hypothetical protein
MPAQTATLLAQSLEEDPGPEDNGRFGEDCLEDLAREDLSDHDLLH